MGLDLQQALNDAWGKVIGWLEAFIASLPNLAAALVVLLVAWAVAKVLRRVTGRVLARISTYSDVNRLLSTAVFVAALAVGLFMALGVLDLDRTVTSLLAGAGIVGLALGFAFQDTAENLIAGVLLNVRREMTDGDIIETNEYMGVLERVALRATLLRTFDGRLVAIPNSQVYKNPLVNYTDRPLRRVDIGVGVSYGDDLQKAARVAAQAVQDIESRDRDRDVEVFYTGFGDSSINFTLRFWIPFRKQTDYLRARHDAILRVKEAFDAQGITIPFPIRTLDFSPVGGVVLREALPEGEDTRRA